MTIRGEIYCDSCFLHIGLQKHTKLQMRGRELHFHNRAPGDCWEKHKSGSRRPALLETFERQAAA